MSAPDDGPRDRAWMQEVVEAAEELMEATAPEDADRAWSHLAAMFPAAVPSSRPGSGAPADAPPDALLNAKAALWRVRRLASNALHNPYATADMWGEALDAIEKTAIPAHLAAQNARRARPVEAAGGERPDHWWRQAVIDTARAHGLDAIGFFSEVCGRLHARSSRPPAADAPTTER